MTNPTNYSSPAAAHRPAHGGYPGVTTEDILDLLTPDPWGQAEVASHDAANCPTCLSIDPAFGPSPKDPAYRGPCPRCGQRVPNNHPDHDYPGALSREDNETYVCSECGVTEAMSAFLPNYPAPYPLGSYGVVA